MASVDAENFRLAVLNPAGRDPEQHFGNADTAPVNVHPPVNFHAYAACTGGAVFRETKRAIASGWPVLVLLRGDFRATARALSELKKAGRITAVSLKETGVHQIAQQLSDPARFAPRPARNSGKSRGGAAWAIDPDKGRQSRHNPATSPSGRTKASVRQTELVGSLRVVLERASRVRSRRAPASPSHHALR